MANKIRNTKKNKRVYSKKKSVKKTSKMKGSGLFDAIKKGFGTIQQGLVKNNTLDEASVKTSIEKKVNLNNKLLYISNNFSSIINKYWDKLLTKQLDKQTLDKLISMLKGFGYYDSEEVEKIVTRFGNISNIKKQDIRTCISLYIFLDNLFELNDISSRFLTKSNKTGEIQTDIWLALKEIVSEVSSEIDFNTVYKEKREKKIEDLLVNFKNISEFYKADVPQLVQTPSTTPSPSPSPSQERTPSPSPSPEPPSGRTPSPSLSPARTPGLNSLLPPPNTGSTTGIRNNLNRKKNRGSSSPRIKYNNNNSSRVSLSPSRKINRNSVSPSPSPFPINSNNRMNRTKKKVVTVTNPAFKFPSKL